MGGEEESAVKEERSADITAFPVALGISSVRRKQSIDTKPVEQTSWISVAPPSVSTPAVCVRPELHDVVKHVGRTDLRRSKCRPSKNLSAAPSVPDTRANSPEAGRSSTEVWAISTAFSTELMHTVIHKGRGISHTFVERTSRGIFLHVVGCCCAVPGSAHQGSLDNRPPRPGPHPGRRRKTAEFLGKLTINGGFRKHGRVCTGSLQKARLCFT